MKIYLPLLALRKLQRKFSKFLDKVERLMANIYVFRFCCFICILTSIWAVCSYRSYCEAFDNLEREVAKLEQFKITYNQLFNN